MAAINPNYDSHIWYAGGKVSICEDRVTIPADPINFDGVNGVPCQRCQKKMEQWLDWWTKKGKA